MKKKIDYFGLILNIIIILLAILIVYWFFQLMFGGSPGIGEFNFALIMIMGSFLIKTYREVGEIKVGMRYSFMKIREDMSSLKKDTNSLKDDMSLIKKRLKVK